MKPHPIQPLAEDEHGTLRFKKNRIVEYILDWCASKNGSPGYNVNTKGLAPDLNTLSGMDFPVEDWRQLAQLIGYSLSGYGSLSYVDDASYAAAEEKANGSQKSDAEIQRDHYKAELDALKRALQKPMARLFEIHPDDLHV